MWIKYISLLVATCVNPWGATRIMRVVLNEEIAVTWSGCTSGRKLMGVSQSFIKPYPYRGADGSEPSYTPIAYRPVVGTPGDGRAMLLQHCHRVATEIRPRVDTRYPKGRWEAHRALHR